MVEHDLALTDELAQFIGELLELQQSIVADKQAALVVEVVVEVVESQPFILHDLGDLGLVVDEVVEPLAELAGIYPPLDVSEGVEPLARLWRCLWQFTDEGLLPLLVELLVEHPVGVPLGQGLNPVKVGEVVAVKDRSHLALQPGDLLAGHLGRRGVCLERPGDLAVLDRIEPVFEGVLDEVVGGVVEL